MGLQKYRQTKRSIKAIALGRKTNMNLREFFAREKHVAIHAQSRAFRIRKWIVIIAVSTALYVVKGPRVVAEVLVLFGLLGIVLHFFLRYKTHAWTRSWGPYTRIPLNGE